VAKENDHERQEKPGEVEYMREFLAAWAPSEWHPMQHHLSGLTTAKIARPAAALLAAVPAEMRSENSVHALCEKVI
jgi:hypothetical protein